MGTRLGTLGNGDPNFSVVTLTRQDQEVTAEALHAAVAKLFSGDAETVLLYIAGHGIMNPETNTGHIVSQDGRASGWGMSLGELLAQANKGYTQIKSTLNTMDSWHYCSTAEGWGRYIRYVYRIGRWGTIHNTSHNQG